MKMLLAILVVVLSALHSPAGEPAASKPLFNGADLSGWAPMGGGKFYVTNGVIRAEGGKGWLRTEQAYTNFILEVEWRGLEANYNSGIFLRAPLAGDPWATNVWQLNTKQSAIGELLEGSTKIVPGTTPKLPAGEWVKFRVQARGSELVLDVNGQRTWTFSSLTPTAGFIGLQAEGKAFEFRNLTVQILP